MTNEASVGGMLCEACLPQVKQKRAELAQQGANAFQQDPGLLIRENVDLKIELARLREQVEESARAKRHQGSVRQGPVKGQTANHRIPSLNRPVPTVLDDGPTVVTEAPVFEPQMLDPLDAFREVQRELASMKPVQPTNVEHTALTRIGQIGRWFELKPFFRRPAVVSVATIAAMALVLGSTGKLLAAKKQERLASVMEKRAEEPSAFVTKDKKLIMRLEPGQVAPQAVAVVQKETKPVMTTRQPEVRKPKPEPTPAKVEPTAEEKEQDEKVSAVIAQAAMIEIDAKVEEMRDKYDGALLDLTSYSFASELCDEQLVKDHVSLFQFLAKKLPLVQHTERAREITAQAERLGRTIADLKAEKRCGELLPVDNAGRNSVLAMNSEIRRQM